MIVLGQNRPYIKSNLLLSSLSICICSGFRRSRGRPARLTFSRLHFRNLLKRNSIAASICRISAASDFPSSQHCNLPAVSLVSEITKISSAMRFSLLFHLACLMLLICWSLLTSFSAFAVRNELRSQPRRRATITEYITQSAPYLL